MLNTNEVSHSPPVFDELLTTKQLAVYLQVSVATLEKQRSLTPKSHPPYIKMGRAVRYKVADVLAWLNNRKQTQSNLI
jgi:excisionase family DNA binding protein